MRIHLRSLLVCVALTLITLAVVALNLASGDFPIPLADVLRSLAGQGDPGTDFIVRELRLPRVLLTVLVGAALGLSGKIFQSLTRNPLGSPDFVGITVGAATGALIVILLFGGSGLQIAAGAIGGSALTTGAVFLLTARRGAQPFRLVLMGVGISALLEATNSFLIYRARLDEAISAQVWMIGSVNGRGWAEVAIVGIGLTALLPLALHYGRYLAMLELGDEVAVVHGVPIARSRAMLAFTGTGLAAAATAAAGPIAFVALAAPPLAALLARSPRGGALPSAVMGAALLTAADWVAQRLIPGNDLPVGVVTAALGGLYLTWLLFLRRGTR